MFFFLFFDFLVKVEFNNRTLIIALDEMRNNVARSLTTFVLFGTSSPVSKSDNARCSAKPCFDIKS